MPAAADATPHDAVAALVAVGACDASPARAEDALGELAEAARAAAGARGALIWTAVASDGDGRVAAAAGIDADPAAALGEALAATVPPAEERELRAADDRGPPARALRGAGLAEALLVPVRVAGSPAGVLLLGGDDLPARDPLRRAAVRLAAVRIGALLDIVRLRENLERAMAQILATDERMLGRIGLDIHDGPTQQLSVAMLEVQLLEADVADAEAQNVALPESLRPALSRIYETVGGALHEMRELIGQLRPAQFEDRRLPDILQDAITGFESRTDCTVGVRWDGDFPVNGVSITQRITLYRILQETLTNAHRHGRASHVEVCVSEDEGGTTLEVRDDGVGFDPGAVQRRRPGMPLARFGLHGMRDRAQILGGSFAVASAPGEGTTVRVVLPRWRGAPPEVPVDVA